MLVGFLAVMAMLAWLGRRVRSRGGQVSEAVMGPFEEIWHPAAHRARFATETVEERMVPIPSADDSWPNSTGRAAASASADATAGLSSAHVAAAEAGEADDAKRGGDNGEPQQWRA